MSIDTQLAAPGHLEVRRAPRYGWTALLLGCGVASSLLWVGSDVVASLLYEGYSYRDQTVSELSAIGAETRSGMLSAVAVYGILTLAFAAGVWRASGRSRPLKAIAALLALNSAVNLFLTPFASMHTREVLAADGGTLSDTLHLATAMVNVLFFFVAMAIGAGALGHRFRVYSIVTVALLLTFGGWTAMGAADVAANQPTPWLGITERVSAYGWMLWVAVLAAVLLRRQASSSAERTQLSGATERQGRS